MLLFYYNNIHPRYAYPLSSSIGSGRVRAVDYKHKAFGVSLHNRYNALVEHNTDIKGEDSVLVMTMMSQLSRGLCSMRKKLFWIRESVNQVLQISHVR